MSSESVNVAPAPETIYEKHDLLPINVGDGKARILKELPPNRKEAATRSINVWDYIATLLRRTNKYSNALEDFFSPTIKSFKFTRDYYKGSTRDLTHVIWREGNEVLVR
jgi:hypothetical protein